MAEPLMVQHQQNASVVQQQSNGSTETLKFKQKQSPSSSQFVETELEQQLQQLVLQINIHKISCDKNFDKKIIGQTNNLIKNFNKLQDKSKFIELIYFALNGPQSLCSSVTVNFTKALIFFTIKNVNGFDLIKTMDLIKKLIILRDKILRKTIINGLINFIKHRRNLQLKQILFSMISNALNEPQCARIAQKVLIYCYQKQFWQNEQIVNVLAECVFYDQLQRIQVCSMRFFLGSSKNEQGEIEESDDSSDDSDVENKNRPLREIMQSHKYTKKTRKRKKQLEEAKKREGREKRAIKSGNKLTRSQCNLEAIRSIYDPQKFSDRLFGLLVGHKKNEKYVVRLLQISLCARVIGIHKLQTLGFYSYLHRYLQPKQKEVTKILLYSAQSCHEFVPSDIVEQLVRVIAQNFVTDRNSEEAITVGLNTIKEIYSNCPDAANEGMVRDLAEYKNIRNKNVSMAAHSLIVQLRIKNRHLLHHKDRGRPPSSKKQRGAEDDIEQDEDNEDELMEDNDKLEDEAEEEQEDNNEDENEDSTPLDGLPRLKDIEHFSKKRKQTKEERMEQIRLGRNDRTTTYAKPKKKGSHVGRTNRELAKRKNFKMVQHKMRGKNRHRSFRDRQLSLRAYLLRQQGKKA